VSEQHYGDILYAGRTIHPGAEPLLAGLATDRSKPAIVRSTALSLLVSYGGPVTRGAIQKAVYDEDPYVRIGALRALEVLGPEERYSVARHLLRDPLRAVRIEAARAFASVPSTIFGAADRSIFQQALGEYRQSLLFNGDRPVSYLALASLHIARNELDEAEGALWKALELNPRYVFAYANLADLYRLRKNDAEGETLLRKAIAIDPNVAQLHYALGLLLARQKRQDEALGSLKTALDMDPDQASHAYGYAIALNSAGQPQRAVEVLEESLRRNRNHRDLLIALVTINRDRGASEQAVTFARRLFELAPQDPAYQQLLRSLLSRR
jgi:tetratricopeptide (TPR) repeat protein